METPSSPLEKLENVFRSGLMLLGTYFAYRVNNPPSSPQDSIKVQQMHFERWLQINIQWMKAQMPLSLAITLADMYLTYLAHTSADFARTCPAIISSSSYRHSPLSLYLGFITLFAAASFRFWAYDMLKDAFTLDLKLRDGQKLVTTGPYAWVRHPSYTGYILFHLAMIPVYYRSSGPVGCVDVAWWKAAVAVMRWSEVVYPVWALMIKRIPKEEILLREWFPREWPEYVSRTWKLVPGVY